MSSRDYPPIFSSHRRTSAAAARRVSTPSLSKMAATWLSAVRQQETRITAIWPLRSDLRSAYLAGLGSLLVLPSAIQWRISAWRAGKGKSQEKGQVPRIIAFSQPTVPARVFAEPRHLTLPRSKPLSWSSPVAVLLLVSLSGDALF